MNSHSNFLKRNVSAVKQTAANAWYALKPGPRAVRGAARGLLAACGLVYLAFIFYATQGPLLPGIAVFLFLAVLGLLVLWAGQGIAWAIGLLAKIPWGYRWSLAGGLGLVFLALMAVPDKAKLAALPAVALVGSLVGAGIASIGHGGWCGLTRVQRAAAAVGLGLGLLGLAAGAAWYAWRGPAAEPIPNAAEMSGAPLEKVSLPNPALPGQHAVKTLTYGAGTDRYRPEFAAQAALKTEPVDGSKFLYQSWDGFSGRLRELWWGFGPEKLPLNGRVWYPEGGDGPFPLVLIVHGNHSMSDFSDSGYAYLGELMASRGFIFVSVDENFINGGAIDLFDSFSGENDARGWLLLEHLRVWKDWNAEEGNPFAGRVDMNKIAVMGHSRGGEAAVTAAAFNRLPYYPDGGEYAFNYNFNIRAVAAIAPIDGQYNPSWKPVELSNVNYFVLQGSHDTDLYWFDGINVLERMRFTEGKDWFKSALYIYRANHGQFNSTWGDNDRGGIAGGFLDRGALLDQDAQEQIAKVYLSAFLEAALNGQSGYLPLFADSRSAGEGWLPDTVYIHRLERAGDRLAAAFEEDINLKTGSLPGVKTDGVNFEHWREQKVHSKNGGFDTTGVYLGWNKDATAVYSVVLPDTGFEVAETDTLIFSLADANQDPGPGELAQEAAPSKAAPSKAAQDQKTRRPIDLTVMVEYWTGEQVGLPLSRYRLLQPQLPARLHKEKFMEDQAPSEPVLQSYAIPLADFKANGRVRAVRFVFDRTPCGSVILDGVGFR